MCTLRCPDPAAVWLMLGLAKMGPASWRYYASEIGAGHDDYWTAGGEDSGRWVGAGSAAAGLAGKADLEQLGLLFGEGRHPLSGRVLGQPLGKSSSPVAGFSLSFSAPKSVSLLWGLGPQWVAAEVRSGHEAAVASALAFLEEHAAFTRRGRGGPLQIDSDGLLAAAFLHRTSRALDPQLHTHVLISNKVRGVDGRWGALDGRELYAHKKAAGMLYQAALRSELTHRLGVDWNPVDRHGQADVAGVPQELCERFSRRRQQVEIRAAERMAVAEVRLGRSLTEEERAVQFQAATMETRPAKDRSARTTTELAAGWRAEATAAGHTTWRWVTDALGRLTEQPAAEAGFGARADQLCDDVLAELQEQRSTWTRAHVVQAMARRLSPGERSTLRRRVRGRRRQQRASSAILRWSAWLLPLPSRSPLACVVGTGWPGPTGTGGRGSRRGPRSCVRPRSWRPQAGAAKRAWRLWTRPRSSDLSRTRAWARTRPGRCYGCVRAESRWSAL